MGQGTRRRVLTSGRGGHMLDVGKLICTVLQRVGPERVVTDWSGYAVSARRVPAQNRSAIVFVRTDGWTLGSLKGLEDVARRLWADEWIAEVNTDLGEIKDLRSTKGGSYVYDRHVRAVPDVPEGIGSGTGRGDGAWSRIAVRVRRLWSRVQERGA